METNASDSRYFRVIDRAIHRPFVLTIGFVAGAAVLLFASTFIADTLSRRIAEDSTVRRGAEQAEAEVVLLSDDFARIIAGARTGGNAVGPDIAESPPANAGSPADLARLSPENELDALFSSIGSHRIGIFDSSGDPIWSHGEADGMAENRDGLLSALGGHTVAWLNRDFQLENANGGSQTVDLVEVFIPLFLDEDGSAEFVYHSASDVTALLNSNVAAIRSIVQNTRLVFLGLFLGVLAVAVFMFDLGITRCKKAVIGRERAIQEELGGQNRELQRLDDARNEFLSSLSHELKTPLAAILGFTQVLKKNLKQNLDSRQVQQLEIVARNGRRLDSMINDLLDLSRIQTGRIKLITEQFEATGLLREIIDGFTMILGEKEQSVALVIEHDEAWLVADQTRVAQVVNNLISNASKYSQRGSSITVTSQVDEGEWVVSVADRGNGIRREHQGELFTIFYRTPDAVNSSVAGTGIGLFVAKQIVELHDGRIDLASEIEQGTTVTFRLPGVSDQPGVQEVRRSGFGNAFEDFEDAV